jgi:hypothetical protein
MLGVVQGNLSIRYVPNQSADKLLSYLTRHLEHEFSKLRSSNTLEVDVRGRGCASFHKHIWAVGACCSPQYLARAECSALRSCPLHIETNSSPWYEICHQYETKQMLVSCL